MAEGKAFLQSVKNPALKYEILSYDAATKTATMQGQSSKFEFSPFTKENVAAKGYTVVKVPAADQ